MRPTTLALVSLAALAGCSSASPTDHYAPFDSQALAGEQQKMTALESFRETLESKDFTAIRAAYDATLKADLSALQASHDYVTEGAGLGAALDAQVEAAITLGTQSSDVLVKEAAEEIIQAIVLRYRAESAWAGLRDGTKLGWDQAFARYGRSTDGKTSTGLAAMAAERDTEFGIAHNDAVYDAFIEGRAALDAGKPTTAAAGAIDTTLQDIFGLSARHEFAEARAAVDAGNPTDAVEGFAIGRALVHGLHDYMGTLPGSAPHISAMETELAKGDPTAAQSMSQVSFPTLLTSLDAVFGFAF